MADITPVKPVLTGVVPGAVAAAGGGDAIVAPRGNVVVQVTNGGGGSINVTIAKQQATRPADATFPAMTVSDFVVAVAAGASKYIGPIPPSHVDAAGKVQVTYSGVTSVTINAIDLNP